MAASRPRPRRVRSPSWVRSPGPEPAVRVGSRSASCSSMHVGEVALAIGAPAIGPGATVPAAPARAPAAPAAEDGRADEPEDQEQEEEREQEAKEAEPEAGEAPAPVGVMGDRAARHGAGLGQAGRDAGVVDVTPIPPRTARKTVRGPG